MATRPSQRRICAPAAPPSSQAAGSTAEEARTVADNLVLANLSGHDSHGVGMVPRYVDAVLEGGLDAQCRRRR